MLKYLLLLVAALLCVVVCKAVGEVISFKTTFLDIDIGFWSGMLAGLAVVSLINLENLK